MRKKRIINIDMNLILKLEEYKLKGISYIDGLVELSDILKIEIEDFIEMLPTNIIDEIKIEFVKLKMIKNNKINFEIKKRESIDNIMNWLEN